MEEVENKSEEINVQNQQIDSESAAYKRLIIDQNLRHLSFNLTNLSIVCTCFIALLFLGQIITVIVGCVAAVVLFAFLMAVTIVTLGVVYFVSDFGKLWGWFGPIINGSTTFLEIMQKVMVVVPYVSAVGILAGAGTIVCNVFCKRYRSVGRIVTVSIMMAISLTLLILYLVGVGK